MHRITPEQGTKDWTYFGPLGTAEEDDGKSGSRWLSQACLHHRTRQGKPVDIATLRQAGTGCHRESGADGRYFEDQLLKASQVDPKLMFISGWNDWAWCLQIEPAKEYDFKYLDIAARFLGRETETSPYRKPKGDK